MNQTQMIKDLDDRIESFQHTETYQRLRYLQTNTEEARDYIRIGAHLEDLYFRNKLRQNEENNQT
jgi:hypothetical protein